QEWVSLEGIRQDQLGVTVVELPLILGDCFVSGLSHMWGSVLREIHKANDGNTAKGVGRPAQDLRTIVAIEDPLIMSPEPISYILASPGFSDAPGIFRIDPICLLI